MYNSKILQHYVEQEWTMTNSNLELQGERRAVTSGESTTLDQNQAAEIPDMELDVAPQDNDDDKGAHPFGKEAWDTDMCSYVRPMSVIPV